jgi:ribosomal protein S18 acetylase RimI-like enzyme
VIKIVEDSARRKAKDRIQLRVFKDNPAQSFYHRIGFKTIEDQDGFILMEKVLEAFTI